MSLQLLCVTPSCDTAYVLKRLSVKNYMHWLLPTGELILSRTCYLPRAFMVSPCENSDVLWRVHPVSAISSDTPPECVRVSRKGQIWKTWWPGERTSTTSRTVVETPSCCGHVLSWRWKFDQKKVVSRRVGSLKAMPCMRVVGVDYGSNDVPVWVSEF